MKLVWEGQYLWGAAVSGSEVKGIPGGGLLFRAKVPGGWFVYVGESCFFYPEPEHKWDGNSLP